MATSDGVQNSYLFNMENFNTYHLKIYNKVTVGLPEKDRCDLTRSKWKYLCQEPEDAISTVGLIT